MKGGGEPGCKGLARLHVSSRGPAAPKYVLYIGFNFLLVELKG